MTAADPGQLTATDMVRMLRRHYLPEGRAPGGLFAAEIGSPCGTRRADALWMPTSIAGARDGLIGHEIKVLRSDVLAELAEPTKADPWAKCCRRWWLVVSAPALVEGLEVPEVWGIMSPPSGRRTRTMTVLRPAPLLKPGPMDEAAGFRKIAAWEFYRARDTEERLRRDLEYAQRRLQQTEDMLRSAQVRATGPRSEHADRVSRILHAITARARAENVWTNATDEEIIAAVLDTVATRESADRIRHTLATVQRDLETALNPIRDYVRDEFAKAVRLGAASLDAAREAGRS